jgi:hypothetical protein
VRGRTGLNRRGHWHYDLGICSWRRKEGGAGSCSGVKEGLKDENGGYLVDYSAVAGAGQAGGVQVAVGFSGGEAFVPEIEGQLGFFVDESGKGLGFDGLGAEVARHIEGVADNEGATVVPAG